MRALTEQFWSRRKVLGTLLAGTSGLASQTSGNASRKIVLYAALGSELMVYGVDVAGATLAKVTSVSLPENVQEAWPHPSRRFIYIAWSNNRKGSSGHHGVTAFRIDEGTGALRMHGEPAPLPARPVFITLDNKGEYLIPAYNDPSGVTVHRINRDGTLGGLVPQKAGLDFGIYAHQVRVDPSNRLVMVVTRGNGPAEGKPEDPGAVKVFSFEGGKLSNLQSVAPGGGFGFQARHLDFHPTQPFVYLTLERQNKLLAFRMEPGPKLSSAPAFTRDALKHSGRIEAQATSAIHVHPNGRFVYLGNRGLGKVDYQGKQVLGDWENSIAVYSINERTGEPTLIQNADTRAVHPRTFALDPAGRLLVVANMERTQVREGNGVRTAPPCLSVFRIGDDGKLTFVRKYDQAADGRGLFWVGMVSSG